MKLQQIGYHFDAYPSLPIGQEENMPLHLLVQILKGAATNKIQRSGVHEADIFGLLKDWPNKYITKAMSKSC